MNSPDAAAAKTAIRMPDVPALWVNAGKAHILMPDGEMKTLPLAQAQPFIHKKPVLVCHAPYMCKKMGVDDILAFDVLTLFAFVHPTRFCVPTPAGLAKALDITIPFDADDYPFTLAQAT